MGNSLGPMTHRSSGAEMPARVGLHWASMDHWVRAVPGAVTLGEAVPEGQLEPQRRSFFAGSSVWHIIASSTPAE